MILNEIKVKRDETEIIEFFKIQRKKPIILLLHKLCI